MSPKVHKTGDLSAQSRFDEGWERRWQLLSTDPSVKSQLTSIMAPIKSQINTLEHYLGSIKLEFPIGRFHVATQSLKDLNFDLDFHHHVQPSVQTLLDERVQIKLSLVQSTTMAVLKRTQSNSRAPASLIQQTSQKTCRIYGYFVLPSRRISAARACSDGESLRET